MHTPKRRLRVDQAAARAESERQAASPVRKINKPATGYVGTSLRHRGQVVQEETREVGNEILTTEFSAENPPALIRVSAGLTKNMGDFNSLRIEVSIEIPVDRLHLEEGYLEASQFVVDKVAEEELTWCGEDGRGR